MSGLSVSQSVYPNCLSVCLRADGNLTSGLSVCLPWSWEGNMVGRTVLKPGKKLHQVPDGEHDLYHYMYLKPKYFGPDGTDHKLSVCLP